MDDVCFTFSRRAAFIVSLAAFTLATTLAGRAADDVIVSQKNTRFAPGAVTVGVGQPVVIVNDDDKVVHHAYVESDAFNFDSGDQQPGKRTSIVFPSKGQFTVLCGIHPKMRLDVTVK